MQLAQTLGAAVIEGFFGGVITILLGLLVLDISPPSSALAALLFFLSVWLGFLIKFLVSFLMALICFRTMNAVGLIWAHTAMIELFSGALIPLQFFPGWLRTFALLAPFQAIVYTPLAIYLGKLQGSAMWQALGIQVLWVGVLWVLARLLWRPSLRALDIQGG
jgi:ABC-2 type transport system permease protein